MTAAQKVSDLFTSQPVPWPDLTKQRCHEQSSIFSPKGPLEKSQIAHSSREQGLVSHMTFQMWVEPGCDRVIKTDKISS